MTNVLEQMRGLIKSSKEKNIAVLVDGPNMIRKELGIDLDKIKKKLQKYGKIKVAKVFLDQFASDKLIEAVTNQGYEVVIIPSDVDVALALDAAEYMFSPFIDTIAIVSRDSDFKPVLTKAKEHGKDTIVVGTEPDFSSALKNTADVVIDLKAENALMDRKEPKMEKVEPQELKHKPEAAH
ncbi:MAG: TIGR00288 family NYN domain-containing protein [Candidatus Micrarchaeota archaeon]